jgi:hypothetical protein
MKNIEILYTCDVGMSEEPIFSYTFLEYVRTKIADDKQRSLSILFSFLAMMATSYNLRLLLLSLSWPKCSRWVLLHNENDKKSSRLSAAKKAPWMAAIKSCGCGLVTTFAPPVWNPNWNFLHSEWMCQRWAGTAGVDYHNSCHNDTVEIGNLRFQGTPWIHSWTHPREN